MKRTKTKILSVFLSFCMIISCMVGISVTASADDTSFVRAASTDELDTALTDPNMVTYTKEQTEDWINANKESLKAEFAAAGSNSIFIAVYGKNGTSYSSIVYTPNDRNMTSAISTNFSLVSLKNQLTTYYSVIYYPASAAASTTSFVKVTNVSQITEDNVSEATVSEAKTWIISNLDTIKSQKGNTDFVGFVWINKERQNENEKFANLSIPYSNLTESEVNTVPPVYSTDLSNGIDWFNNGDDVYICSGSSAPSGETEPLFTFTENNVTCSLEELSTEINNKKGSVVKVEAMINSEGADWAQIQWGYWDSEKSEWIASAGGITNAAGVHKVQFAGEALPRTYSVQIQHAGNGKLLWVKVYYSDNTFTELGSDKYAEYTIPSDLTASVGQTLASVTLPTATNGTWTWTNSTTSVGARGKKTFPAVFTPNDTSLSTVTDIAVPVTVGFVITLTGGANSTIAPENGATQTIDAGAMTDVTFTATEGNIFPESDAAYGTTNGVTVERTSDTVITVSGTPTGNATITIPDAGVPHTHVWGYDADDATITASCSGTGTCDITTGLTMTISAPAGSLVYDGTPKAATLNNDYNTTAFPGSYPISYYKGTTALNGAPSGAGTYTAKVTAGTATAQVGFTIEQAEPTITTAPTASAITYGQLLGESTLTGGAANVPGTFAWTSTTILPQVSESGTADFEVTFTPNDTDNYTTATCTVKLTVGKAIPTITTAPDASAITYGQTLADSTLSGGAADVDGTFAWTTPATAPAAADSDTTEYDVTFTPNDTDNYTTAAYKVTLTVNKADPTYTAPTANELTYTGDDLDLVTAGTVTGGRMVYSLDNQMFDDSIPTGKDAGEYTVYYMVEGDENHNDVDSSSIKVTIARADQSAPAVTAVAETIKGKADGKITGVNATMEYRADNENGYNSVTGTAITDLEPGTYHVRVKEDANHFASPDTTVTVEEGRMLTVTFKTDSTTVYTTAECEYKGTVSAPAEDPEKEEHRFKYWQLDGEEFDFSTEITEDIELIARWEGLYDIKVIRGTADKEVAEAGETVTIKADYFDNMGFECWSSDEDVEFDDETDEVTTFIMPAEDVEIAANYFPNGPIKPKPSGGSSSGTTPSHSSSSSDVSGKTESAQKLRAVLNADNSLTVDWDKISGASKYILYYEKDGKDVKVIETTKTKITIKTAKNNFTYKFKLKYVTSGQTLDAPTGYTATLKSYYKPVLKLTQKDGKITASWKQVPGAEYYKVYKVVNGKLKFVTETTKTAVRFTGKSGKTYTYTVSAVVNNTETKLTKSDRKSIKVK